MLDIITKLNKRMRFMIRDEFKSRYTTIPFATSKGNYEKNSRNKDHITLFHKHREMELMIVLEGRAMLKVGTEIYEIEKGDVIIICPYMLHNATIFADCVFRHYCLCFDMSIIPDAKMKTNLESGAYKIRCVIKSFESIAGKLASFIRKSYEYHNGQLDGWELQVIGNLSCFFGLLSQSGYIMKKENTLVREDICYRIIDHIEKNYSQNISLDDMAAEFFVSKSYFCRIFKRNFGKSFNNYVCTYRIEKSAIFLRNTDLSVSQIASAVGFNSFSFFCKMFKRHIGMSPTDYRKAYMTAR